MRSARSAWNVVALKATGNRAPRYPTSALAHGSPLWAAFIDRAKLPAGSCHLATHQGVHLGEFSSHAAQSTSASAGGTRGGPSTFGGGQRSGRDGDRIGADDHLGFVDRQHSSETPFFVWFNANHMHFRTHPKPESVGQAGRWQSPYHDTMIDHDKTVGALLDKLDELDIAENTIVIYSSDNAHQLLARRRSAARRTPTPSASRRSSAGPARSRPEWFPTRSSSTARRPQMIDSGMSHIGFRCVIRA
jgi:hypothetical protein